MQIEKLEGILHADLDHELQKKYTIVDFCRHANISRYSFYSRFGSMSSFVMACINFNTQKHLIKYHANLGTRFFRYLIEIEANKLYYRNMMMILDKKYYQELLNTVNQCNIAYCQQKGRYSVTVVTRCSTLIYCTVTHWVGLGCPEKFTEIYQTIHEPIRMIDQQHHNKDVIEWP